MFWNSCFSRLLAFWCYCAGCPISRVFCAKWGLSFLDGAPTPTSCTVREKWGTRSCSNLPFSAQAQGTPQGCIIPEITWVRPRVGPYMNGVLEKFTPGV
jgi:hypothetical protein